jgi:hypothetical protein
MDEKKLDNLLLMYGQHELRWSVLFVDVKQDRVEPLVTFLEGCGFVTTAVLRDPDSDTLFFVQVSETRTHDAASLRARTLEMEDCARAHDAAVADWSAKK